MSALLDSFRDAFAQTRAAGADADAAARCSTPHCATACPACGSRRGNCRCAHSNAAPTSAAASAAAPAVDPALLAGIPRRGCSSAAAMPPRSRTCPARLLVDLRALGAAGHGGGPRCRPPLRTPRRGVRPDRAAALADEGTVLRVEDGVAVAAPLHLVFVGAENGADRAWHRLIELRRGFGAIVVDFPAMPATARALCNALARPHLARGARRGMCACRHSGPRA